MCSGAARALSWTNRDAIERRDVARRQAASRDVPQSIVVGIQQPDRDERITEQALDHVAEAIKNRAQQKEIVEVRSCQGFRLSADAITRPRHGAIRLWCRTAWRDLAICRTPDPPAFELFLVISCATAGPCIATHSVKGVTIMKNNMTIRIDNVTVLGTGVLGSQIAYQSAYSGFGVTAYDISDEIVNTARKRFAELAARYEREVEGASDGRARAALDRIRYSSNLADAVRDADLVIEAVPEIPAVKRDLYAKLGSLAPEKAIFATNSSTMLPSSFADATGRPDRFLALHFANEIWIKNVAEIMGHAGTTPAVYDATV